MTRADLQQRLDAAIDELNGVKAIRSSLRQQLKETQDQLAQLRQSVPAVTWPSQHDYTAPDVAGAAILDCRTAFDQAIRKWIAS